MDVGFRRSQHLVVGGTGAQVVGYAVDVVLHARDPGRAAAEGPFTLVNPGHLLVILGLAASVAGLVSGSLSGRPRWAWALRCSAALGLAVVVGVGVTRAGAGSVAHGTSSTGPTSGIVRIGHGGTIHSDAEVAISWSTLRRIDADLATARAAAAPYQDVEVARRDGYQQVGPSREGVGAHFVNFRVLDEGRFDLRRPTFLLYERRPDWSLELVGVGWFLPRHTGATSPTAFAPLAAWHFHEYEAPGLCIGPNGTTNLRGAECTADGGRFWRESPWMLHAWLFRDSPAGVFSLENPTVHGSTTDPEFHVPERTPA